MWLFQWFWFSSITRNPQTHLADVSSLLLGFWLTVVELASTALPALESTSPPGIQGEFKYAEESQFLSAPLTMVGGCLSMPPPLCLRSPFGMRAAARRSFCKLQSDY